MVEETARRRPRPRRGEIWEVWTPGQPSDEHQPRPALVISEDVRNEYGDDVLVVPIFSAGFGPTRVPISGGEGGLDHDSVLFCEEVTCLYEDFLQNKPLGNVVRSGILRLVVEAIRIAVTRIE